MKPGKRVTYVDRSGKEHEATITAVPGTGRSGYKTLDLDYTRRGKVLHAKNVVHEGDAGSDGHWV